MPPSGIFVTGTNTGIGKTLTSALIMAAAKHYNFPLRYFKPIQTGEDSDSKTVKTLADLAEADLVQPFYSFSMPATPYLAAKAEDRQVDIFAVRDFFKRLEFGNYLVEGAGGLLVPLTNQLLLRDLIVELNIPIIIVAGTQLGTMNHSLLTVEAAAKANIPIKGFILSGPPYPGLKEILWGFTQVPILAEIPQLEDFSSQEVQKIAKSCFPLEVLHNIFYD